MEDGSAVMFMASIFKNTRAFSVTRIRQIF